MLTLQKHQSNSRVPLYLYINLRSMSLKRLPNVCLVEEILRLVVTTYARNVINIRHIYQQNFKSKLYYRPALFQ